MKKMMFLLFAGVLFSGGCASSERMARLSGGVVQEYSVPGKHRLRSGEFQKKTASFSRQDNVKRNVFAEKSLINIWPFFFRSDDYYSVLWPFFDYDPYGFALRPLFNKEGEDYSVLFPLIAWNTANKDGWAALLYWNKRGTGFFPFFHHTFSDRSRGVSYTLPLYFYKWSYAAPNYYDTVKQNVMTAVLTGYYGKKLQVDISRIRHLYPNTGGKYPEYLKQLLAYKLYGSSTPVPGNVKELEAYRKKMFDAAPVIENKYYGLFPLYFGWQGKYHSGFNLAGILMHHSRKQDLSSWSALLHLLYSASDQKFAPLRTVDRKQRWVIPVLLFYAGASDYKAEHGLWKKVKAFEQTAQRVREPFAKNLPELKKRYKELTGKEMPQVICSYPLAKLWLEEFAAKQKFQTFRACYGGFLPLYCFYSGKNNFFWTSPALLTFSDTRKTGSFFLSIPLLTWWTSGTYKTIRSTAWYLGWYSKQTRHIRAEYPVFDRSTWRVKPWQQFILEDEYALCGLYYHGKDGFSIAKSGLDAGLIESIRKRAFQYRTREKFIRSEQQRIAKRLERNLNWKVSDRLSELKKMVDAEEIRLQQEKFEKNKAEFENQLSAWSRDAAKFGILFDRSTLKDKNFDTALDAFMKKTTEVRFSEDFGSGLFFRKELDANGDHKWHAFCYLASGSRKGNLEKTQFLHFFYRYNRENEREEKIIFPFITIRKDKNSRSSSFLWRLWENHETPAGKGGYIFFIPWGR